MLMSWRAAWMQTPCQRLSGGCLQIHLSLPLYLTGKCVASSPILPSHLHLLLVAVKLHWHGAGGPRH